MSILTTILAGIVMLVVLVVVHEAGHMVVAKMFGVGVPVFSVGIGPRIWGIQIGGTDYRISALPIGGYVQMSGADAFGDEESDAWVPPEQNFMRKPPWQRFLVMLAGPVANLALPFVLLTGVMMLGEPREDTTVGRVLPGRVAEQLGVEVGDRMVSAGGVALESWSDFQYAAEAHIDAPMSLVLERDGRQRTLEIPPGTFRRDHVGALDTRDFGVRWWLVSTRVGVDDPASPAGVAGLQTGDAITAVDGEDVRSWDALQAALTPGMPHRVDVLRATRSEDGAVRSEDLQLTMMVSGWQDRPDEVLANPWGLRPVEVFIGDVMEDGAAKQAGLQADDRLVSIDGAPVRSWADVEDLVRATVDEMGPDALPRSMQVVIRRAGAVQTLSFTPRIERNLRGADVVYKPLMGIYLYPDAYVPGDETHIYYTPAKAMGRAWKEGVAIFDGTMKMLGNLATGATSPKESVGGPVAIFHIASKAAEYGIFNFVRLMAHFSFSLGIFNLLPVPLLDGGRIALDAVEAVRGRPLPLELRERVQMVGFLALIALMLSVTVMDVSRLFE